MMKYLSPIIFILTSLSAQAELANAFYLRTGAELLKNDGTRKGSSTNLGGLNLILFFPIQKTLLVGAGYSASFDITKGSLPIAGYSIHGKWYFKGEGATDRHNDQWGNSSIKSLQSYYAGSAFTYYSYFLGRDTQAADDTVRLEGKYSNLNIYAGADFAIDEKYGWNIEMGTSAMTMAGSDDRVKIKTTFFLAGICYFF